MSGKDEANDPPVDNDHDDDANSADDVKAGTLDEGGVVLNPWEATGKFDDDVYDRLVEQFGVQRISSELLERFTRVTGHEPHVFMRRGLFFAHRNLDEFLDAFEKDEPVFLYTGRGPSGKMHIGHRIAMDFTVWLQEVFDAVVVFQIADDEKYWFKDKTFEQIDALGRQNLADIIALGFNADKTFIFSNRVYSRSPEYQKVAFDMLNNVRTKDIKAIFGIKDESCTGQLMWPIYQSTAAFSQAFGPIFRGESVLCLVAYAIDQDPYFRLCRDVAPKLGFHKPCSIMCRFLPALEGDGKMSTTGETSQPVFMSDSPAQIKDKINKHAFSGGQDTVELHHEKGGNPDVDVAFQWLRHFLNDDEELAQIEADYRSGKLLTGQLKARCIEVVSAMALDQQARVAVVTPAVIREFCTFGDQIGYDKLD